MAVDIQILTLSVIVRALKRAYPRNGHLVVACGPGVVTRAIDLGGLRQTLRVYGDRAEALAALRYIARRGGAGPPSDS